jgi:Transcriptional regulatory protein, C terminal
MYADDGIASFPDDVVVLRWPDQRADALRLARIGRPHLLLVEPGTPPPEVDECIADWIRLPVDDADVKARLATLTARASRHPVRPAIDEHGELSFRGSRVFLSPTDERLARMLVASFDRGVSEQEIRERIWHGGDPNRVRVHVSRLRKRVQTIGLEITSIRGFGYRLHVTDAGARGPAPTD